MNNFSDLLANFFVGITFVFSGTVKLNDPRGFAYKIEEYLQLLASRLTGHIRLLLPYILVLAVVIATLEVVLGVALLIHWQRFWALRALLLLTLFFFFLTLYTAISKRITSCGCFGNALPLTPWQSFTKSTVLLLILGRLCWREQDTLNSLSSYYWVGAASLLALSLGIYTLRHLPLFDLSSYKIGSDLAKNVSKNAIHSTHFCIWQGNQEITQTLLTGNRLLIIARNLTSMSESEFKKLNTLTQQLQEKVQPMLIAPVGQGRETAKALELPLYTAHPILLNTMLRARLGLLLLSDGVVVSKWNFNDLIHARKSLHRLRWLMN